MSIPSLLLVDGTALAYRAHYAIAGLTTKSGAPTNAVYGFIRLLDQLKERWKPSHWVVVFDLGAPAHRLELLPTYKAQRDEMPGELAGQFPAINEYLAASNIPSLMREGVEADDLIATLAARTGGERVHIATADKDMFQLVGGAVGIVSLTKAGERMGRDEVKAKTGVWPEQIVAWLALMGDSADNIPGVPGVGPKTAAKLLEQFGSLEVLWAHLDRVESEKLRAALSAHRGDVERNALLARLQTDLPMDLAADRLQLRRPDVSKLVPFLERMEFKSMAERAREASSMLFDM